MVVFVANLARMLREKMRMLREDAASIAHVVDQAFKGQDELSDDELDAELRQVFYDLQDEEILEVRRHEYTRDGRLLRGYMWHVREHQTPFAPQRQEVPADPMERLYGKVKPEQWAMRPTPANDPVTRGNS